MGLQVTIMQESERTLDDEAEGISFLQQENRPKGHMNAGQVIQQPPPSKSCSITDDFLQIIRNANEADDTQMAPDPIDVRSINYQPPAIQMLWDRFADGTVDTPATQTRQGRIESWFLHHQHNKRCHASRITLVDADFMQWTRLLRETWQDSIWSDEEFEIAVVHPETEDAAVGIIAQIIITQRPQSMLRSALLSVYDSAGDDDRSSPHTFALVLPERLQLEDVLLTLQFQLDCPPHNTHNHCSLWFGHVPVRQGQIVSVRSGFAFRLVISRGILLHLPLLLNMDNAMLRRTLQQAIVGQVYQRPPQPAFTQSTAGTVSRQPSPFPTLPDGRPEWIQQLQIMFNHDFFIDDENGQPSLDVFTWYLNHDQGHHCARPKKVRITEESFMWRSELIFPWRELFLRATMFDHWVVADLPRALGESERVPHVLVGQGLHDHQQATLVCVTGQSGFNFFAHVFPRRVVCRDVARLAVPASFAHHPITIQFQGQTFLWDDPLFLQSGDCIQVVVHPVEFDPYMDQNADEVTMMQTPGRGSGMGQRTFQFNPEAPAFCPGRPSIETQSEFTQTLHTLWAEDAFAWDDEVKTTKVLVWFVDHRFPFPKCHAPRVAQLHEDFTDWERSIRSVWNEFLVPGLPSELTVVQPAPPVLEPGVAAHVIFVQGPRNDWATSLVTICDPILGPVPTRLAITTHEHIAFEQIVHAVYYDDLCLFRVEPARCVVWYQQQPILPGHPIPGWSGYSLVLRVNRNVPNFPPIGDDNSLLQLPKRPMMTNPAIPTEETSAELTIDFSEARDAIQWLDTHFTLPTFDVEAALEGKAHWLLQCLDWIRSDWFHFDGPVDTIRIYYDGSFFSQTNCAGSAAVAFILQDNCWKFAGAISASIQTPIRGSYTAELTAALLATKFAFDIAKLTVEVFQFRPQIEFVYDSLSVGKQAEGLWQAKQDLLTCHAVRSLLRIIEKRWGLKCQHHFVPSHQGNPGNELADTLANCAAQGHALQDWTAFISQTDKKSFVKALEWTWGFFGENLGLRWEADKLILPAKPSTVPDCTEVLPTAAPMESAAQKGTVSLKLLTCNVLTLLPDRQDLATCGVGGPARLHSLIEQMRAADISIFAFQETRLRTSLRLSDDNFHLFHSPANTRGHFGMLIGITKRNPFVTIDHGEAHPLGWFQTKDFMVLVAEPRLLILRICHPCINCILIAAHAPHTGASESDIEAYWEYVGKQIPAKYDQWARILLADANCRFGDAPNRHIGAHGAETSTGKSDAFAQFVSSQYLFLPATFADLHQGPTGTWRHSNGTWTRNDVIGLPFDWPFLVCQSWTDEDLDFSLAKEDHRPACVHIAWMTCPKAGEKKGTQPECAHLSLMLRISSDCVTHFPTIVFLMCTHTLRNCKLPWHSAHGVQITVQVSDHISTICPVLHGTLSAQRDAGELILPSARSFNIRPHSNFVLLLGDTANMKSTSYMKRRLFAGF